MSSLAEADEYGHRSGWDASFEDPDLVLARRR
jgi:hypothetical protein